MAMRHHELSDEQLELQRAYDRSWRAAMNTLEDPARRDWLEAGIAAADESEAEPMSVQKFLASTEASRPAE